MPLKSIVKVSHLSNLSDARFCSGMGVELLGFGAIPAGEHFMPPAVFQEIRGWLAGPRIIAELYGISSSHQLQEVIRTYAPDYFELTWDEYARFRNDLTLPCIVYCSDPAKAGSGEKDKNIAYIATHEDTTCAGIADVPYPTLIRIRSVDHLQEKIRAACFQGYVLEGPQQVRAGVTSYDELGVILEALEED